MRGISLGGGVYAHFATPFFVGDVDCADEINPALGHMLLAMREAYPARSPSSGGAWETPTDLMAEPTPEMAALAARVEAAAGKLTHAHSSGRGPRVGRFDMRAWGTVYGRGDYASPHPHLDSHWNACYYVAAGVPAPHGDPGVPARGERGGFVEFLDPGAAMPGHGAGGFRSGFGNLLFPPREGLLLAWPSPLRHFVHPYHGPDERPRMSISFAVRVIFG